MPIRVDTRAQTVAKVLGYLWKIKSLSGWRSFSAELFGDSNAITYRRVPEEEFSWLQNNGREGRETMNHEEPRTNKISQYESDIGLSPWHTSIRLLILT